MLWSRAVRASRRLRRPRGTYLGTPGAQRLASHDGQVTLRPNAAADGALRGLAGVFRALRLADDWGCCGQIGGRGTRLAQQPHCQPPAARDVGHRKHRHQSVLTSLFGRLRADAVLQATRARKRSCPCTSRHGAAFLPGLGKTTSCPWIYTALRVCTISRAPPAVQLALPSPDNGRLLLSHRVGQHKAT
jgi:hypothetical protein